ncbi:MAG: hypothetical protein OHK006_08850 [Thermodesulfovibrionales bacterium]
MKKATMNIALLLILSIVAVAPVASAEEAAPAAASPAAEAEEAAPAEQFHFPTIDPEISLTGGFRYAHIDGSKEAMEYEYFRNSPVLRSEVRVVTYPHRLHLDLDFQNERDYYGDVTYGYKDLVYFRGLNSTLYHNLGNIELFDLGAGPNNVIERRDADEEYGIKVGMSNLLLRLKMPDYPAHLYGEANFVTKDGTRQQIFLGGAGGFGGVLIRTSEKREIDWTTSTYTVGANGHFGPVEVDYSHTEKRFSVDDDRVMEYNYEKGGSGALARTAGVYEHNAITENKSSTDTIRLHTMMTGQITASATLSRTERESRSTSANADSFYGSGEVTWIPVNDVAVFLKYRHYETDLENPDRITVRNLTNGQILTYSNIRDSVDSVRNVYSGAVRVRPFKGVTLRAELSHEDISREDYDAWFLPDSTQKTRLVLSGDFRIVKGLMFKAKYTHLTIDEPALNTEADSSEEVYLSLTWTPTPKFTAFASYTTRSDSRDDVRFIEGTDVLSEGPRSGLNDRFVGVLTYLPLPNLSLTATYAYQHAKVEQAILTGSVVDERMPYKTTSQNVTFDATFRPKDYISLAGGVSHTTSKGAFYPSNADLLRVVSIDSFSYTKIRETSYYASGEYSFKGGFSARLNYRYTTFNDASGNRYDDVEDGRAQIVLLTLTKKW